MAKPASWARLEVDSRVELIAAVLLLANGDLCRPCGPTDYAERLRKRFRRRHSVLERVATMGAGDWRHLHPTLILLDFTDPPALEIAAHFDHYANQGKDDALARFMPELRDFAASRDFAGFFAEERDFHEELLAPLREPFAAWDFQGPLERYLGLSTTWRYHFITSPLLHGETMHNLLYPRADGTFDIYSISGHDGVRDRRPVLRFDLPGLSQTAWHEVAHTCVDPITQDHRAAFEPLAPLYALMTGKAKNQYNGPAGWLHMVDEHIIRGVTSRLAGVTRGEEEGRRAVEAERKDGFTLVGPVYEALKRYEAERDRYPTLRDFYPRLIETFQKLYASVRPAAGFRK